MNTMNRKRKLEGENVQVNGEKKNKMTKASEAGNVTASIVTPLWSHQLECVEKMHEKEATAFVEGHNLGILCQDMGGGKTLTILSALIQHKRMQTNYEPCLRAHTCLPDVLIRMIQRYVDLLYEDAERTWDAHEKRFNRFRKNVIRVRSQTADEKTLGFSGVTSFLSVDPYSWEDATELERENDDDGSEFQRQLEYVQTGRFPHALFHNPFCHLERVTDSRPIPFLLSPSASIPQPNARARGGAYDDVKDDSTDSTTIVPGDTQTVKHRLLSANLVVVPFHLFGQWKQQIAQHTIGLKCHFIHSTRDVMQTRVFDQVDVVLCNSNKYTKLARYCNEQCVCWQRVIFDETHAIRISNCLPISALFYWAVTTTYTSLHSISHRGFLFSLFTQLDLQELKQLCVQSTKSVGDQNCFGSFQPYNKYTIRCKMPPHSIIVNALFPDTPLSLYSNEMQDDLACDYLRRCILSHKNVSSRCPEKLMADLSVLELKIVHLAQKQWGAYSHWHSTYKLEALTRSIRKHRICSRCLVTLAHPGRGCLSTCCNLPYCSDCCSSTDLSLASFFNDDTNGKESKFARPGTVADASGSEAGAGSEKAMETKTMTGRDLCSGYAQDDSSKREKGATASGKTWTVYSLVCANCRTAHVQVTQVKDVFADQTSQEDDHDTKISTVASQNKNQCGADGGDDSDDDELKRMLKYNTEYERYRRKLQSTQTRNSKRRGQLNDTQLDSHIQKYCVPRVCSFIADHSVDKFEACRLILQRVQHERTLIFVNASRTQRSLQHIFTQLGTKSAELKYQSSVIAKRLQELETHKLQVLVLNGKHVGNGLNIQCADNIIIVSIASKQLLMQDIARAQRPGRTGTLNVFELE